MKKIALFPIENYKRDELSRMSNEERKQIAEQDADVMVLDIEVYLCNQNDECYYGEDWAFPIDYADELWEVSCEWKTDCDGVQFETKLFKDHDKAMAYLKGERQDRISDYEQHGEYTIESDTPTHFLIQSDDYDVYEELTLKAKYVEL